MLTASLSSLVSMVRAEAGHSVAVSQGLNTVEGLKHIIRRTQYELWTAFNWPTLKAHWDVPIGIRQTEFAYPKDLDFDQIRTAEWTENSGKHWTPVQFGIPLNLVPPPGVQETISGRVERWDTFHNHNTHVTNLRVWPTPNAAGFLRLIGQCKLNQLVDEDDNCTLDAVLISLFAAAEILQRAKAEDAGGKMQKAQRHLTKTLANTTSDKLKVSTFGASRGGHHHPTRIVV